MLGLPETSLNQKTKSIFFSFFKFLTVFELVCVCVCVRACACVCMSDSNNIKRQHKQQQKMDRKKNRQQQNSDRASTNASYCIRHYQLKVNEPRKTDFFFFRFIMLFGLVCNDERIEEM